MIDKMLSNKNSQDLRIMLELRFEELREFVVNGGEEHITPRTLISTILVEYLNLKGDLE